MALLQIQVDDTLFEQIRRLAESRAIGVEQWVREVLQNQMPPPPAGKKYSFVGIGHSGTPGLSRRVDEVLAEAPERHEGWSLGE